MFCVSSLAHRVLFAARRLWCRSIVMVRPPSRGGAPGAQGAAVAPFGEGGAAAGAYAGGVAGGAGHCSGSGVDPEVVAVVAVFDAGFAYDGFDDGDVMVVGERFESRTGSVRRVSDDVGAGWFFADEFSTDAGVGGVSRGQDRGGYEPGLGFGRDMGLVSVPFAGPGFCDRAGLGGLLLILSGPWLHSELSAIGLPGLGPVPRPGP